MSASAPSSAATCSVPETMYPRCVVSQLSPPTNGLMHSDHRNPGSACNRFTVTVPRCTTDAVALVGVCISSGLSMLLVSMLAMPLRSPPALVGAENPATSCGLHVLVHETAEPV